MDTKLLRQKILDLAIHGKLVPQNPADEPASVLLERIKAEKERLIKAGKIKKSAKTSDTPHYDNVPFEIPSSWVNPPIEELFILNPKSDLADDVEIGFIPMTYVDDGFSGKHKFEKRKWGKVKKGFCHFQNGDIGIAKISPCFENQKSTIFSSLPNSHGAGTTELVILRSLGVDVKFFLYLFKSNWYLKQGTKYFKGVVGQQRVNKAIFTELKVPLPPLSEQRRIVAEIEKWFSLIDIIESSKNDLQSTIKQTKSKILDLAIHGKLVPQNPKDEPAIELLKRINPNAEINCDNGKNSFEVPNGWCWTSLKDIFLFIRNGAQIKQAKSASGLPITRIETISNSIIDRNRMGYADINNDIYSDYYIKNGDILVSHINSPKHVGKCALCTDIKKNEQIIHGMNLLCLRPYYTDMSKYIFIWFKSATFIQMIHPYVKNAVNQASLNIRNLGDTIIPIPPLEEQQRIVAKIEELFAVIDNIQKLLEA